MSFRRISWLLKAFVRRHRVLSISIVILIFAAAFLVKSTGSEKLSADLLNLFSEKKFSEGLVGAPVTLNPLFVSTDTEKDLSKLLFRGLTKTDFTGKVTGDLAESWQVSNNQTYLFHLKPNLHFQDGEPITADDVAATYKAAEDPNVGSPLSESFKGLDIQVVSPQDIIFRLPDPFAPFLAVTDLGILPKKILDRVSPGDLRLSKFNLNPIGSTGFRLQSLDAGLARFKKGDTEYEFRFYSNPADLETAVKLGEVTTAGFTMATDLGKWPTMQKLTSPLYDRVVGIFYNLRSGVTANLELRYGLSYALDANKLASLGYGEKAEGPIPPVSWAASTNFRHFDQNIASAKSFLDKAGWTGGPVRQNSGKSLEITLSYPDTAPFQALANEIASEWGAVGVRAILDPLSLPDFKSKVIDGKNFQAAILTQETGIDPDQYVLWHSLHVDNTNIPGLKEPKVDKSLEDGRQTVGQAARKAIYGSFQHYFMDLAPVTFLYYPKFTYYVSDKVSGLSPQPLGVPSDRLDGISHWSITRTIF